MLFPASCLAARILWWWWGDSKADRSAVEKKVFVFIGRRIKSGVGNITTLSGTWKVDIAGLKYNVGV